MNAPAYFVQFCTPTGGRYMPEDGACADLDAAVDVAGEQLHKWPDFCVWATPADAPRHDATADVKRALAARYEAAGYSYDIIPTAMIDFASDELRAEHAAIATGLFLGLAVTNGIPRAADAVVNPMMEY